MKIKNEGTMENYSFKKNTKEKSNGAKNILTPLVDCFAIILIYLLMATSFSTNELTTPKEIKLPRATETKSADDTRAVVEIRDKLFFINKKLVSMPQLGAELKKLVNQMSIKEPVLIVQADKSLSYGEMNPVVMAGLLAGFSELQFAVIKEENL